MTNKQIAEQYVDRFPSTSSRGIARAMYKENPACFPTQDAAYSTVRRVRGGQGNAHRPEASRPPSPFIVKGRTQTKDWAPVALRYRRPLILSDLHVPYHDDLALEVACRYGRDHEADCVLLNGDFMDFYAASKWETDPRERDFREEVDCGVEILDAIKAMVPGAKIVFKLGNHDERLESYLIRKAPELLGLECLSLPSLLELGKDVTIVEDKRPIQFGDLNVVHGHEYGARVTNPVNPARGLFLRARDYALCGHFHQSSYHPGNTVRGKTIACWSTGCLCDLHPKYLPMNEWSHGFAMIFVEENGKFNVDHKKISSHGKIY